MIERILTIETAAERLNTDVDSVKEMIETNQINAVRLPNGGIAINEKILTQFMKSKIVPDSCIEVNTALLSIKKFHYRHLANVKISYSQAKEKYGINHTTLRNWQLKGFIRVLKWKSPRLLNEEDVAYCVAIYNKRKEFGSNFGWPLLDEDGNPNLQKYPGYALYYKRKHSDQ